MRSLRLRQFSSVTWLLLAVNLALAMLVALRLAAIPSLESRFDSVAGPAPALPETPAPGEARPGLQSTRTSPLMHASRQPWRTVPAETPVAQVLTPPFSFVGYVAAPDDLAVAVVLGTYDGQTRMLRLGDAIDGWTVSAISNRTLELHQGEVRIEIDRPIPMPVSGLSIVAVDPRPGTGHGHQIEKQE